MSVIDSAKKRIERNVLNGVDKLMRRVVAKYDGATNDRRVGRNGWQAPSTGPNTELKMSAKTLRDRSRDLARNNHIAIQAVRTIVNGVVGDGIIPHVIVDSSGTGEQTNADKQQAREIEKLLKHHMDTPRIDAEGNLDLYGLQDLAMHSVLESGDCLIVREWRTPSQMKQYGLKLPYQIRILEADYLVSEYDSFQIGAGGNQVIQGCEVDKMGRVVAYHVYTEHPGEYAYWSRRETRRISADDAILLYEILRPGQIRGVPEMAPIMLDAKSIKDYDDAQLMRQKIAACFTAFVTRSLDDGKRYDEGYDLHPGLVWELNPGEDVKFADPPPVQGYTDYMRTKYRGIAAASGITYEALTQDFSQVNYASSRMAFLSMHANFKRRRRKVLLNRLCWKLQEWTMEALAFVPQIRANHDDVVWTWNAPRQPMLDPGKEAAAYAEMVRDGFRSHSSVVLELGYDPETVDQENAIAMNRAEDLGLYYDTNVRKVTKYGMLIEDDSDGES
jgi:lambda family phage portal protein